MNMRYSLLAAAVAAALPVAAQAHISYTGRNFGTFDNLGGSVTIANQTVSGNYGWADGLDDDYGDSHRLRAFRFTLTDTVTLTFTAMANASATPASVDGLLPGFSIYSGLAHLTPLQPDHDFAAATQAYLASLPGVPKEGAFRSMADWKVTNDSGDPLSVFTYMGSAFDADLDGIATGTFTLGPGDYSVFVGGVNYVAQIGALINPNYGLSATLAVAAAPVPEPETWAMLLAGLGLVGFSARRRMRGVAA
ncbi:PEP-CTERM sorting domain-containing protein [Betaproteobacteria bacterium SCN1]|jgi:hypothetical protein|nr:PEP-CTERM sorting domain-containing protein [Betaproteobacteria bacterium SCN1]